MAEKEPVWLMPSRPEAERLTVTVVLPDLAARPAIDCPATSTEEAGRVPTLVTVTLSFCLVPTAPPRLVAGETVA